MPKTVRPGDVLADRYRLVDLLTESGAGRFWRAHDAVLERHVALHVIAEDDERAAGLLEAARRSATVLDRHLLRVLDADQVDGLCYVVNEWGDGSSLDVMLAHDGPLGPRRAAWLVSEVAACIAVAHEAGVAHGRLVPENVLIDRTGSVRVIGFAVDAALHGLPPGRISTDVADLGGLLYCALTGKWPGVSRSPVPAAPHEHGQVLRPRQVRAGIPRPLDSLCDEVVNPYAGPGGARARRPRPGHRPRDRRLPQRVRRRRHRPGRGRGRSPPGRPGARDGRSAAAAAPATDRAATRRLSETPDDLTETQAVVLPDPEPDAGAPAAADPAVDQLTQAGLPIFDDDTDDVSWLDGPHRPGPATAAVRGAAGAAAVRPRAGPGSADPPSEPGSPATTGGGGDYWPWEPGTGAGTGSGGPDRSSRTAADEAAVPGRSWLRLAAAIAAGLVLLVAIVVAYNLGRGRTPLGAEPQPSPDRRPRRPPTANAAEPEPITGVTATDLDPQGDPPEENPELAPASRRRRPGHRLADHDLQAELRSRRASRPVSA